MRDQDQRHLVLVDEVGDQVENLLLHGHVECRGGFVGNQQFGPAGERHGNRDALALPAGELVRIRVDALRGLRNADAVEQRQSGLARLFGRETAVQSQGLGDLVPDGVHGVQRRHRLLKNHADALTANRAHRLVR